MEVISTTTTKITGLFTVQQLRWEIGDPTKDPTEAGWVSDEMLQGIIDRHVDAAVREATLGLQASSPLFSLAIDGKELIVAGVEVPFTPGVVKITVPDGYFQVPSTLHAAESSLPYSYDVNILTTVYTDPFPANRKRFGMLEGTLVATGTDAELFVGTFHDIEDALVSILGTEAATKINNRILNDARMMLAWRIKEGNRLEALYEPNDGILEAADE